MPRSSSLRGMTIIYEMGEGDTKREIEALVSGHDREIGLTVESIDTGEHCMCLNKVAQIENEPVEQYYREFDEVTARLQTGKITSADRARIFCTDRIWGRGGMSVSIACAFE